MQCEHPGKICVNLFLSGKGQQLKHPPPPPMFTPVNGAPVISQTDQHNQLNPVLENSFEAKATSNSETSINPFRKAANGTETVTHNSLSLSNP